MLSIVLIDKAMLIFKGIKIDSTSSVSAYQYHKLFKI